MKRKKLWIGLGLAVIIVLMVGLNIYRNHQEAVTVVQVFQVKQDKIEETVLASGKVEVPEKQEITARTNAIIQEVRVAEGDAVQKGQVLLKLDTTELLRNLKREEANLALQQANLAKSKAGARPQEIEQDKAAVKRAEVAYATAKAKYERNQVLYREGAISGESLDTSYQEFVAAESEFRSAQQRLSLRLAGDTRESIKAQEAQVKQALLATELAREELARAEVTAPMDGVILSLQAEKGKYVTVGTPLAVIGSSGKLQVRAEINEADSGNLKTGQPVKITSSALPKEEFFGKIIRVGAAAQTKAKSNGEQTDVQVLVGLSPGQRGLKPGYSVDIKITTASKANGLVVPYEAVLEKGKVKEVFVVDKGKARKRRVETGIGNELYLTVEKGLKLGDKVIVNPPDKLRDGSAVEETPYQTAKYAGENKAD